MIDYEALFAVQPYSMNHEEKKAFYQEACRELGEYHRAHCEEYQRIIGVLGPDMPIPVRLFKEYTLMSMDKSGIQKTMTSSGTSGQTVSRIYLDRDTSARQTKALTKIVSDFIGKKRLPMLIIDSSALLKNRAMFSARGAGILGFSMLGRDATYALDENMKLDLPTVTAFCERHQGEQILLFGFTFMIWQHFYRALKERGIRLSLENGVMIHGGGWKKLEKKSVDNAEFKREIQSVTGVQQVYNYYGMVEQTGSIFMECAYGHLHASIYSDIKILDFHDFSPVPIGTRGVVQLTSLLPTSYPGHILLTEDEGTILGEDDCPCGRLGKYFEISGRIKGAEIRGCSDTYEKR